MACSVDGDGTLGRRPATCISRGTDAGDIEPGHLDHPGSADNEQTARALLDAFARFDLDAYESLIAEDAVERRPQTGDRFVGRAKIAGMYRHYPADPPW